MATLQEIKRNRRYRLLLLDNGPTESDTFTDTYGGFTYLGTIWEYSGDVTKKGKVKPKSAVTGTTTVNAEPALVGGDANELQYGIAKNHFVYAEYVIGGYPNGGAGGTGQNFFVGFSGDANGSGAASATRLIGPGYTWNGTSWGVITYTYAGSNSYPKTNDNSNIPTEWDGEAHRLGVLLETDGTRRVWSHVDGEWTTSGGQGGDPDGGGTGYPDAPDGGTGWLLPMIKAYAASGLDTTGSFYGMAVVPLYTPALADVVIT